MKIDRRNPLHWLYLGLFGLNALLGACLRPLVQPFVRRTGRPLVLLYGHRLNGNLLSLYELLRGSEDTPCEVAFLTMDPDYYRELAAGGAAAVLALSPAFIAVLARTRAMVSDHGLHAMSFWLPRLTSIRCADVWHGVPFKGWDADDFRALHGYDEIWVSSSLMRRFYIERFGFRPQQVHATGYGRTDRLVRRSDDVAALRRALGAPPPPAPVVLFAPTWQHEADGRSVFPFGSAPRAFFAMLDAVCREHGAFCLFRTHLNTRLPDELLAGPFAFVPQAAFPDSEGVLLASDVLVCDWSSIAFDFLLLERPTIFLDVPAPFEKGFTLGPEYRFGAVVGDLDALGGALRRYLADPHAWRTEFAARAAQVRRAAYDDLADGHAAERYRERLAELL